MRPEGQLESGLSESGPLGAGQPHLPGPSRVASDVLLLQQHT